MSLSCFAIENWSNASSKMPDLPTHPTTHYTEQTTAVMIGNLHMLKTTFVQVCECVYYLEKRPADIFIHHILQAGLQSSNPGFSILYFLKYTHTHTHTHTHRDTNVHKQLVRWQIKRIRPIKLGEWMLDWGIVHVNVSVHISVLDKYEPVLQVTIKLKS